MFRAEVQWMDILDNVKRHLLDLTLFRCRKVAEEQPQ